MRCIFIYARVQSIYTYAFNTQLTSIETLTISKNNDSDRIIYNYFIMRIEAIREVWQVCCSARNFVNRRPENVSHIGPREQGYRTGFRHQINRCYYFLPLISFNCPSKIFFHCHILNNPHSLINIKDIISQYNELIWRNINIPILTQDYIFIYK